MKSLCQQCSLSRGWLCQIVCTITGEPISIYFCYGYITPNPCGANSSWGCVCRPLFLLFSSHHFRHLPLVTQTNCLYSLKIWCQFRRHSKSHSPSALVPITPNRLFPPSFVFLLLERNGVQSFNDLYIGRGFGSFTDLSASHDMPTTHLIFKLGLVS